VRLFDIVQLDFVPFPPTHGPKQNSAIVVQRAANVHLKLEVAVSLLGRQVAKSIRSQHVPQCLELCR
jgi:hypothetical protein